MNHLTRITRVLMFLLAALLFKSCEKKADEFSNSEQITYYLSYDDKLSTVAESDGAWQYISNYIYPEAVTTCEWSYHLTHNITKDEYGYDLLFWSASPTSVKIELILLEGTGETVLLSKILNIPYYSESMAVQHVIDIVTNPVKGINPGSGKDGELILRMTYNSGTDRIEILYDANSGMLGCTSIVLYQDI